MATIRSTIANATKFFFHPTNIKEKVVTQNVLRYTQKHENN